MRIEARRKPITRAQVHAERDRRLAKGVTVAVPGYGDVPMQGRERDMAIMANLRDTARDLCDAGVTDAVVPFRDADNVHHDLTPEQAMDMIAKGRVAAQGIYDASWSLLAMNPIPQDYADDRHWPNAGATE